MPLDNELPVDTPKRPGLSDMSNLLKTVNRVTVSQKAYHQHRGEEPTPATSQFSILLKSSEQPFIRLMRIPADAQVDLSSSWVKEASILFIKNETSVGKQIIPAPEEIAAVENCVVRVSFGISEKGFLVRPGRSLLVEPEDLSEIRLQCLSPLGHEAEVKISVFPN